MLNFLKKRRYRKTIHSSGLMSRINRYLSSNYTPPAPSPSSSVRVRYSVDPSSVKSLAPSSVAPLEKEATLPNDTQYSLKTVESPIQEASDRKDIRYSVSPKHHREDDYDDAFCDPFDDIFHIFNKPSIDELKPFSRPIEEIDADLEEAVEMSFVDKLLSHISEKKLRDTQVYKAAHIDRKLFSKIASNRRYTPSKDTCLALCFALQLSLEETKDLLSRAEHALTHSNKRDIVIEYLIRERIYDLFEVNEILHQLGMKALGY